MRQAARWWERIGPRWLLVLTCLAGWGFKAHCGATWLGSIQYVTGCYSDAVPFWGLRGVAAGQIPYVQARMEYPVLTGLTIWAEGFVTRSLWGPGATAAHFLFVVAAVNAALAFAVLRMMERAGVDRARRLAWAGAPPLVLYLGHNWDMLAVAFAVAAMLAARRGAATHAAALAALGGAAKLFPILLLPLLGLGALFPKTRSESVWKCAEGAFRRCRPAPPPGHPHGILMGGRVGERAGTARDWLFRQFSNRLLRVGERLSAAMAIAAAAFVCWVAVNAPMAWAAFANWSEFYRFSSERAGTAASVWELLGQSGWWASTIPQRNLVSFALFVAGAGVIVALGWQRHGGAHAWRLFPPVIAWFLLTNKVYSPQFDLWLYPLLLLTSYRLWPVAWFALGDLLAYFAEFWWFAGLEGHHPAATQGHIALAAAVRAGAMLWIVAAAIRQPAPPWSDRPDAMQP